MAVVKMLANKILLSFYYYYYFYYVTLLYKKCFSVPKESHFRHNLFELSHFVNNKIIATLALRNKIIKKIWLNKHDVHVKNRVLFFFFFNKINNKHNFDVYLRSDLLNKYID